MVPSLLAVGSLLFAILTESDEKKQSCDTIHSHLAMLKWSATGPSNYAIKTYSASPGDFGLMPKGFRYVQYEVSPQEAGYPWYVRVNWCHTGTSSYEGAWLNRDGELRDTCKEGDAFATSEEARAAAESHLYALTHGHVRISRYMTTGWLTMLLNADHDEKEEEEEIETDFLKGIEQLGELFPHAATDDFHLVRSQMSHGELRGRLADMSLWIEALMPWIEPPLSGGERALITTSDDQIIYVHVEGWSNECERSADQ